MGKKEANNRATGMQGEALAAAFLEQKQYSILETNFRGERGEIDIIAQVDNIIAFVEVKYRSSLQQGYPREAVGTAKQKRIISAAKEYIYKKNCNDQDFRFDVIEILGREPIEINHIENAFWS